MNKNILNTILVGAVALGLASCDENSWNDRYLDGFEGGVGYDNPETSLSYTLTEDDYETISKLLQSVATTTEETNAAKAIGSNYYFDKTSPYPASVALAYFLGSPSSPYYYVANGSSIEVSFAEASETPEEIAQLSAAASYTVTNANYQSVWGSESAFISSFAPDKPAASNLASILKSALPDAEAGDYVVVTYNTASQNPMFGYPDAALPAASLYTETTLAAGSYFMGDLDKAVVAANLTSNFGYLPSAEITSGGESITGVDSETQLFEFEAATADNEFYIKDPTTGKYYYQSGTYNSFNVSEGMTASGTTTNNYTWVITSQENNSWKILNKAVEKWVQTPFGSYSTWGSYNYAGDGNNNYPQFFVFDESSSADPVEIPLYTPASTTENAVYYYNGSTWSVADGVLALNPADYTTMGFSNNSLTDPEIYLPIFLKSALPYSQSGDQEFVVYNYKSGSYSVDLFLNENGTWTLNNNGLENISALFTKSSDEWNFVKYLGKAIYNLFTEDQLELDRSYLIVSQGICANPVPLANSYGYLQASKVSISGEQIIEPNENNAFTFQTSFTYNDNTVNVPDGYFVIRDSNGRYLYLQGTYSSFNVRANNPYIEADGSIGTGYLFSATKEADGTWAIVNLYATKTLFYSGGYNNWAAYASAGATDYMPTLYLLDE